MGFDIEGLREIIDSTDGWIKDNHHYKFYPDLTWRDGTDQSSKGFWTFHIRDKKDGRSRFGYDFYGDRETDYLDLILFLTSINCGFTKPKKKRRNWLTNILNKKK